jgi:hypothetical protein
MAMPQLHQMRNVTVAAVIVFSLSCTNKLSEESFFGHQKLRFVEDGFPVFPTLYL